MTIRKTNIIEKIGLIIPGYKGYAVRGESRNTDKKLRENSSLIIQKCESLIITH
jgi:hypothetical protein